MMSDLNLSVPLENIIPVSQARAKFAALLGKLSRKQIFILSKKYEPKAALIDVTLLNRLLNIERLWKRQQDFASLEALRRKIPSVSPDEVEKDVRRAVNSVRSQND